MTAAASPSPLVAVTRALLVLALDAALLAVGLGGADRVARDPRALALLAIWGAGGITLAWMRPSRGHDVAESKPDPGPMVVLFFVPLLAPMAGAWAARHAWAIPPFAGAVAWTGVALAGAGLALRIAAMAKLGARFSPLVALQRGHALETGGPYAWVRHPGYAGALLACVGGSMAFGSMAALPLPALMLAAQLARVRAEEALLSRHFGDAWRDYAARTGVLLPRPARGR